MAVQPPSRTAFYKDKRNGKVNGICAGIADYTGSDVTLVRILLILGIFMGGGALIPIYFVAGWISKDKPQGMRREDPEEVRFWQGVRQSPARTTRDIRSRFRDIDNRLADIELYYVSSNKQLADEIESLR